MVDKKLTVYRVRDETTGKLAYMSQGELDAHPGQWKKLGTVLQTGGGRFLTVGGEEAVELGLAWGVVSSRADIEARYPRLQGELLLLEPGAIDTAVQILNSPWITGLLLVLGLVGLYLEFSSPGIGLGGLLAAVCFATFFWSHFLGGTANWLAAVLFLLGVGFLAVEMFILPGFAVAGIAGIVLLIASLVLAMQGFFIPHSPHELAMLTQTLLVVFFSGLSFTVAAMVISKRFGSVPLLGRLLLAPPEPAPAGSGADMASGLPTESPIAVGQLGVAQSALRPGGKARFGNRYADVVADGAFITKGTRVKIVYISGNRVVVNEVEGP